MTFDVVVANPPYQSGNRSIYNCFIDKAIELNPNVIVMITKNNWLVGETHRKIRNKMITFGLKYIKNYSNSKDVFKDCSVSVTEFKLLKGYTQDTHYIEVNQNITVSDINTKIEYDKSVVMDTIRQSIIDKVTSSWDFIQYVGARNARIFGTASNGYYMQSTYTEDIFDYSDEPTETKNVAVIFLDASKNIYSRYIGINELPKGTEYVDTYKVVCGSKVSNKGNVITNIRILNPGEIPTNSFGIIGVVNTEEEARHLKKYSETELFRALTSFGISGNVVSYGIGCCNYIPDIKVLNDIDWNDSIDIINNQLYTKYCIDRNEIQYIKNILNG